VKQADKKGLATFNVGKITSGNVLVSASGYNYNAALGEIAIKSEI
jgi:hypothetical protein